MLLPIDAEQDPCDTAAESIMGELKEGHFLLFVNQPTANKQHASLGHLLLLSVDTDEQHTTERLCVT